MSVTIRGKFLFLSFLIAVGAFACRSLPSGGPPPSTTTELSDRQRLLLEGARFVLGKSILLVHDRTFPADCSGTVLAIYYYAGMDLKPLFERYQGNGVVRLYRMLEEAGLLHHRKVPTPGDLVFWDDTYDRNGDGLWNDYLTHAGMVVSSAPDGTVEYIHAHVHRGIVIERMNLLKPGTFQEKTAAGVVVVNSPMRMRSPKGSGDAHPDRWLASDLYRAFGMAYQLKL